MEGFEVHTSDLTVNRKIVKSEFLMEGGLNTFDLLGSMITWCKEHDYNGMIGLNMTPSAGMGGAQAIIIYVTAVKFE